MHVPTWLSKRQIKLYKMTNLVHLSLTLRLFWCSDWLTKILRSNLVLKSNTYFPLNTNGCKKSFPLFSFSLNLSVIKSESIIITSDGLSVTPYISSKHLFTLSSQYETCSLVDRQVSTLSLRKLLISQFRISLACHKVKSLSRTLNENLKSIIPILQILG